MAEHEHTDELDPSQNTRDWMDLKLASLRSEMRLLFVLSVAGQQVLSHISFSNTLSAVAGGSVFIGGIALKLIPHALAAFRA